MKVPQADDLQKILSIPEFVATGTVEVSNLVGNLKLNPRQAQYYFDAAEILGLVIREKNKFGLSELGLTYMNPNFDKKITVFKAMHAVPIIQEIIKFAFKKNNLAINREEIKDIIKNQGKLSESTAQRRVSSVFNWFNWLAYHFPNFCYCEDNQIRFRQNHVKN
jgi:hypothetical protein